MCARTPATTKIILQGCCMFQGFEVDDDDLITTSEQVLVQGLDPQNIPWDRLQVSRQRYRVSHFLLVLHSMG